MARVVITITDTPGSAQNVHADVTGDMPEGDRLTPAQQAALQALRGMREGAASARATAGGIEVPSFTKERPL